MRDIRRVDRDVSGDPVTTGIDNIDRPDQSVGLSDR
jgi:hypothetical protein